MITQKKLLEIVAPPVQREGGGFFVRKVLGGEISTVDPFLMLDHIGPVTYKPGEAIGAPDHPHRGFETVTYVIDGGVKHQDSAGNKGTLKEGCVQWMTAGRGIVHSEMPPDDLLKNGGKMEGFQLWVNLPAKHKMISPRYQELIPSNIPVSDDGKVSVKVISGNEQANSADGAGSPITTFTPIVMLDIHLRPGSSYTQTIPANYNSFLYVWRGSGEFASERRMLTMGQGALLGSEGDTIQMHTTDNDCHVLFLAGMPINEAIVKYGPFVMNTEVEIQEAILDYQANKMGSMEGKEERMRQTEAAKVVQKKNGTWDLQRNQGSSELLAKQINDQR